MSVRATQSLTKVGDTYGSATAGDTAGFVAADVAGDFIPLQGQFVLVTFRTAGTLSVVTIDSVAPSNQGSDENVTVNLSATDEKDVLFDLTQGGQRFKQVTGNIGYLSLTYSSITNLTIKWKSIA
jgi:hypothetical protein